MTFEELLGTLRFDQLVSVCDTKGQEEFRQNVATLQTFALWDKGTIIRVQESTVMGMSFLQNSDGKYVLEVKLKENPPIERGSMDRCKMCDESLDYESTYDLTVLEKRLTTGRLYSWAGQEGLHDCLCEICARQLLEDCVDELLEICEIDE